MEIKGTFVETKFETFKGKDGNPKEKGTLVVNIPDSQYPYDVAFTVWRDQTLAAIKNITAPAEVTVFFDVKSRKYQDRWFTDAVAWNVTFDVMPGAAPSHMGEFPEANESAMIPESSDPSSDLPF